MLRFLSALLILIVLAIGGLLWWVQDANRLKPQLERALADALDGEVRIDGDLSWQLWPPLFITAHDIHAQQEETTYQVGLLKLRVDFADLTNPAGDWTVRSAELTDLKVIEEDDLTHIDALQVENFKLGEWAPFNLRGTSNGTPIEAEGRVKMLTPSPYELEIEETWLRSQALAARCSGRLSASGKDYDFEEQEGLLPVDTALNTDWDLACTVPELNLQDETFQNIRITTTNAAGKLVSTATLEDFFAGRVQLTTEHTLSAEPAATAWLIKPDLEGVDAQALLTWLGRPLQWDGELSLAGTISATGNTIDALTASHKTDLQFDGGNGTIDISAIKAQIAQLARYTGEAGNVDEWPDQWAYSHLVGRLSAAGERFDLAFDLDNLAVLADGAYRVTQDQLDVEASLTFGNDPAYSSYDVNPLLVGLPIPVDCSGPLAEARCRLDQSKAAQNVGRALSSGENTALRNKLEEKIDEEVPEAYRDAARSLLDLLTGGNDAD